MAIDKGLTKGLCQAIGKVAEKGQEFNLVDLPDAQTKGSSAAIRRLINHQIVDRVSPGRYRLLVDSRAVYKIYKERAPIGGRIGHKGRGKARGKKELAVAAPKYIWNAAGKNGGEAPAVRVIQYDDIQDLIVIGKKIYLGIEVVLTPRRQQHG